MHRLILCFVLLIPSISQAAEGRLYTDPKTGIHLVTAEVTLSSEGTWRVDPADRFNASLGACFLRRPESSGTFLNDQRARALQIRELERERKRILWQAYWNMRGQDVRSLEVIKKAQEEGWLHIRIGVQAEDGDEAEPEVLAFEIAPLVDDGKHWVQLSDGSSERVDIDVERWKTEGITVKPDLSVFKRPDTFPYTLYVQVFNPEVRTIGITAQNPFTDQNQELTITLGDTPGQRSDFTQWVKLRAQEWANLNNRISDLWLRQTANLYEVRLTNLRPPRIRPDRGNTASMLSVLGGEAAIRETLQLQNLRPDASASNGEGALTPIHEIQGVTVNAHAYAELLGDSPGKTVPLARLCPPDRFWLYAPDPAALAPLLDRGADWLGSVRGGLAGLETDHQVLARHLERLGLTEQELKQILKSGMLAETAVMLPDLFLLEGTDVTCIARIRNLQAVAALFQARGMGPSPDPQTYQTRNGHSVTWAMREDLFIISTHAGEVDKVLALHANQGAGSLGDSAEFRYMLTQCGPGADTRAFAFFSDPFIRRLTGPALKIAQYRRLMARADLERIHAGSLMYRQDTGSEPESLKLLLDTGYLRPLTQLDAEQVVFHKGAASHPDWGGVNAMPTLLDIMPTHATKEEASAYRNYRERYESFWRQFFDPIAIHVEAKAADTYETTVFVLPLINSSIYDRMRSMLSSTEPVQPLPRPNVEPAPIAMLSLNLAEENWLDMIEGLSRLFTDSLGIHLPIWDHIGPGLHIAVADSDSILTFGSGEMAGLFSGTTRMRGSQMLMVPMLATLLTRPAVVMVELKEPELAIRKLRQMETGTGRATGFGDFKLDLIKVSGLDRWLIRISMVELMHLSFSLEVQEGYLVISNLPMTYRPIIKGRIAPSLHHAAAWFNPNAADQTRRAFAGSALARSRDGAQRGLGILHAFHHSGIPEIGDALERCRTLFGFVPVHPAPGTFVTHPEGPASDTFGALFEGRQPTQDALTEPYGMFPFLEKLDVTFQLEHEGFRARIRWKLKTP